MRILGGGEIDISLPLSSYCKIRRVFFCEELELSYHMMERVKIKKQNMLCKFNYTDTI